MALNAVGWRVLSDGGYVSRVQKGLQNVRQREAIGVGFRGLL
jgi:hypothetical protein